MTWRTAPTSQSSKLESERISRDFVVGLLRTKKGHDTTSMVVDRLTKLAHFILVRMSMIMDKLV